MENINQKYTISCGNINYHFETTIPKEVLEPFVQLAYQEAKTIYANWYKGAKEKYGDVIRQNPANYISIYQAGMPNEESLNEWVENTAIQKCQKFLAGLKNMK